MYSQAFIRAKNFTLSEKVEGEFSQDPKDPGNWTGGEPGKGDLIGTKFGISAAQYPTLDIPLMRFEDAVRIYERDYWQPICGDSLPPRLAICVFDTAVNQGIGTAAKLLQSVVGAHVDGIIGPATIAAVRRFDQDDVIVDFLTARLQRYVKLKDYGTYGKGWMRRCLNLLREASR